ncbi:hypothetical protein ABMA27_010523 [Loxostege sticticalis]|uniref:Gag protein n=1 Tax=Loxostege sticticalis TaxID=481309 RepID=A0ABR3H5Z5_LOXSC
MSVGKLNEFNVKGGAWSSYMDRLEMYFKVNKTEEDMKLPILIASIGDEAYKLLKNLASPKKPSELDLKKVDELMKQHLQPTPSVLAVRYRFRQRRQNLSESMSAYVAELRMLSKHCKFGESLNDNLRDQFICGLHSDIIRQRLFAEDDSVTFAAAVKLAMTLEAAERDAAMVEETSSTKAVHAITSSYVWPRPGGKDGGASASGKHRNREQKQYNCGACGARNHNFSNCRFREYVCSKCQRKGHLRRVCLGWNAPETSAGAGQRKGPARAQPPAGARPSRNGLYFGEADRESSEECSGDIEEDLHHLCLNDYKSIWKLIPVLPYPA